MRFSKWVICLLWIGVSCLSARVNVYPEPKAAFDYAAYWAKIDNLTPQKYPQTALAMLDTLYLQAVQDKDIDQQIKALMYQMSAQSQITDTSDQLIFAMLQDRILHAGFPADAILHSILAETYWAFYNNYKASAAQRTETMNYLHGNIATWDMKTVAKAALYEFRLSLKDADKLAKVKIADLPILVGINSYDNPEIRPTLFDVLAHRALERYETGYNGFSVLFDSYSLSSLKLLSPAEEFIDLAIVPADTTSGKYLTIKLYQDLIRFHKQKNNYPALADIDVERLNVVHGNQMGAESELAYERALRQGEELAGDIAARTRYMIARATAYYENPDFDYQPADERLANDNYCKAMDMCKRIMAFKVNNTDRINAMKMIEAITHKEMNAFVDDVLIPNVTGKLTLELKNITHIEVRIYRVPVLNMDDPQNWNDDQSYIYNKYENLPRFKTQPYRTEMFSFPVELDYRLHTYEVPLLPLPLGRYILIASDDFGVVDLDEINLRAFDVTVSDLAVSASQPATAILYISSRITGKTIASAGVEAFATRREYRDLKKPESRYKGSTTEQGCAQVPAWHQAEVRFVLITNGADSLIVRSENHSFSSPDPNYHPHKYIKCLLFTDRSIYRPGQTIYCKGVVYETDNEQFHQLLPNHQVTLYLKDKHHKVIASSKLLTNAYGGVDCTFIAPSGALTGEMILSAGDKRGDSGSVTISVEEYKRPRFEVKLDKPKDTYQLGQTVTVTGTALSYAGTGIDGAEVSFTVKRTTRFFYVCWWQTYPRLSPANQICQGNMQTDKQGKFSLTFTALPELNNGNYRELYYDYEINVTVTDINGETHNGTLNLNINEQGLIFDPQIAPNVDKSQGNLRIPLVTTNLSGEKIAAQGRLSIIRLQSPTRLLRDRYSWSEGYESNSISPPDRNYLNREEFIRLFPTDAYGNESDITTWETADQVFQQDFDTAVMDDLTVTKISKWQPGMYKMEAEAAYKGHEIKIVRYFLIYSTTSTRLPYPMADLFIPLQTVCQPGETAQVLIGTGYSDVTVLFEVEKNHKITSSQQLILNNEQRLLSIPVLESDRGNIYLHIKYIRDNRFYTHDQTIKVSWKSQVLSYTYMTFRDKMLPGQHEEWRLQLKDNAGGAVTAELLASMYDASLDALRPHKWDPQVYGSINMSGGWMSISGFELSANRIYHEKEKYYVQSTPYSYMKNFGNEIVWDSTRRAMLMKDEVAFSYIAMSADAGDNIANRSKLVAAQAITSAAIAESNNPPAEPQYDLAAIATRKDFAETAFFYPALHTDEQGEVSISFTVPEVLTKWKFQAMALTQDLKIGLSEQFSLTQKPLMVTPNLPRFFRDGDKITISAKISALDKIAQSGQCRLYLYDALTRSSVDSLFSLNVTPRSFTVNPGESTVVDWTLHIPSGISAVSCKIVAQAAEFSDGEEGTIPILTNRMLVTESLPLPMRGNMTQQFSFDKLLHSPDSKTLSQHRLTLEYTSHPAWYAVLALPYLMENPYESNEQIFNRFYANSLASYLTKSHPQIQKVVSAWQNLPDSGALISNLEKNPELKSVLLQETPWLLDAQNETQNQRRLGMLFDLTQLEAQTVGSLATLKEHQNASGAWSWFPGGSDSWCITQYIVEGMGHLEKLGVKTGLSRAEDTMLYNAVLYLDSQLWESYLYIKTHQLLNDDHLGYLQMHYLYTRGYYKDIPISPETQEAIDYYRSLAPKYWGNKSLYGQSLIALGEYGWGNQILPASIIRSFSERSISSEELGMEWKENTAGWHWYQSPIQTQAILIEAFQDIAQDTLSVHAMRLWLLKQKQTTNWKTTKDTAAACYALLLSGTQWLDSDQPATIQVGGKVVEQDADPAAAATPEAGTGYFKTSWSGSDIKAEQANIHVTNPNPGPAWGAMYWQYFENLDKITPAQTPLKLKKQLFIERTTDHGKVIEPVSDQYHSSAGWNPAILKVGDKVIVRIEISTDRDMEYIHLKDMRSSGFEPINVLSRYKCQDGLGYYEATGDAATNFFIEYLAKGTYVFEYPLRVTNKGDFSNGITSIQCMYAPEFTAHSAGIRLEVK